MNDERLYVFVLRRFPPLKALSPKETINYCKWVLNNAEVRRRVESDYEEGFVDAN